MARKKLTDIFVKAVQPPATGRVEYFDTGKAGLVLRVSARGVKSWSVYDRLDTGEKFRLSLGHYPALTLKDAHTATEKARLLVRDGKDPRKVKADAAASEAEREADTVEAVADKFIARYALKLRWGGEMKRILLRDIVPKWQGRPLADITLRNAHALLDNIEDRAPTQRNRTLDVLRVFVRWSVGRGFITTDFTLGIKKNPEAARERTLNDDEVRALWMAAGELGWPFGDILKLLLLTGARKSEIGEAHWNEINVDDKVMEIPAERVKNKHAHTIPLSPAALAIITDLKRVGATPDFIFTTNAKTAVSGFSKAKTQLDALMLEELQRVDQEAKLEPWVIHDLRRTVRSNLSKLGISSDVAERILGHAIPGIRGVYDRHDYLDEKRAALDRWAQHLAGIVSPRPGNIVPMKGRGRR